VPDKGRHRPLAARVVGFAVQLKPESDPGCDCCHRDTLVHDRMYRMQDCRIDAVGGHTSLVPRLFSQSLASRAVRKQRSFSGGWTSSARAISFHGYYPTVIDVVRKSLVRRRSKQRGPVEHNGAAA
jgi:hypothetical protein